MSEPRLTDEQIRRCVFTQTYTKIGADQFRRGKPYIDYDLPGDDLPETYRTPVVEIIGENMSLPDLPVGAQVLVRLYDRQAVNASAIRGAYEPGDLLGQFEDAQHECDEELRRRGGRIPPGLSQY